MKLVALHFEITGFLKKTHFEKIYGFRQGGSLNFCFLLNLEV